MNVISLPENLIIEDISEHQAKDQEYDVSLLKFHKHSIDPITLVLLLRSPDQETDALLLMS